MVAACACALIVARAIGASRSGEPEDPALAMHRRQLDEIGALAERGLLSAGETERAKTEASRRWLHAADRQRSPARAETPATRLATLGAAAGAPALALGLYLLLGSPEARDQPHADRVRAWRNADPAQLGPSQAAAVLEGLTRDRPSDAQAWLFLGRARLASGDSYGALRAFQQAVSLRPEAATGWEGLGESFAAVSRGRVDRDAERAFREALRRDPRSTVARYQLGRALEARGDVAGAAVLWRAAVGDLPPADPQRLALEAELARLTGAERLPPSQDPAIRRMVDGLAARLADDPGDAEGWARLVRSYGVLGEEQAAAAALQRARRALQGRPHALAVVEREALTPSP